MVYKAAASRIVCAPLGLCVDSVCLFPRGVRGVVATFAPRLTPVSGVDSSAQFSSRPPV